MTQRTNALGQPVGDELVGWKPVDRPARTPMYGRWCRLEPLDVLTHVDDLFEAFADDATGGLWTYMPVGPFTSVTELRDWMNAACTGEDPQFHAIIEVSTGKALGMASYLRIDPLVGVIEVGYIALSPKLQKTVLATEAMYLMMQRVFDELGYRRYEWKCDSLNAPSRKAAVRLGFSHDGTFEQLTIYKGRNRDTAWFSVLDRDWPGLKRAFQSWLAPENFDEQGVQRRSLASFRHA